MKSAFIGSILFGWILITILLAFFIQSKDYYGGGNPIVRHRLEVKEAFQTAGGADAAAPSMNVSALNPEEADLDNPRRPYALLKDWFPTTETPLYPDAQRCYQGDFQVRLERTGNFRQLTNNYKRGSPDSCSGTPEELTLAIYKAEPLPDGGCLGPKEIPRD